MCRSANAALELSSCLPSATAPYRDAHGDAVKAGHGPLLKHRLCQTSQWTSETSLTAVQTRRACLAPGSRARLSYDVLRRSSTSIVLLPRDKQDLGRMGKSPDRCTLCTFLRSKVQYCRMRPCNVEAVPAACWKSRVGHAGCAGWTPKVASARGVAVSIRAFGADSVL